MQPPELRHACLRLGLLPRRSPGAAQVRQDRLERHIRLQRVRLPRVHADSQRLPHKSPGARRREYPVGQPQVPYRRGGRLFCVSLLWFLFWAAVAVVVEQFCVAFQ